MMNPKIKCSLVILVIFLGGALSLLYFTITQCLNECTNNQQYPSPCQYQGESFCCLPQQTSPPYCQKCILQNRYCYEFIAGSAACFIVTIIIILYMCILRKQGKNKTNSGSRSQNLTIQSEKSQIFETLYSGVSNPRPPLHQSLKLKYRQTQYQSSYNQPI